VNQNARAYAKASTLEKNDIVAWILFKTLEQNVGGFRRYDTNTGEYMSVDYETARQKVINAVQRVLRKTINQEKKHNASKNKGVATKSKKLQKQNNISASVLCNGIGRRVQRRCHIESRASKP